ncbi:MAG: thymidine kinase [Clostridia bacterium]|nr:thymidine kinase [Clostridia bacterium]MBQ6614055.1 thymidine kinase [Clostridia bacterium]
MAKLYFKYGAMGSAKTAQALITKYNYEENGMHVWLIKPSTDNRDGKNIIRSRVGLESKADVITPSNSVIAEFHKQGKVDVIIADECQFFTEEQVDELREIVDVEDIPVLCFGLRTDFLCKFFPGSLRLLEVCDTITEVRAICDCGAKATVNARIDAEGYIVTEGDQLLLGGNDRYTAMCHRCWTKGIKEHKKVR